MVPPRAVGPLGCLLHRDTYELFVAPAVADLDYAPTTAALLTVWWSLAGALAHDLKADLHLLAHDIRLIAGLTAMQGCYYGGMLLLLVADVRLGDAPARLAQGGASMLASLILGILAASALPVLFCCWPPRRTVET